MKKSSLHLQVFVKNVLYVALTFGTITGFGQSWELKWSDEFDGPQLDQSVWNIEVNDLGGYNNELQYYTSRPENIRIENGELILEARKENYINREYTSARINSAGKKSFRYGKMEARLKLPYGNGMWPAFWMLGDVGQWPASGEIDIMELVGGNKCGYECGDNKSHGYMWYTDANNQDRSSGTMAPLLATGKYADDYHTFSIEWDETSIKWFIDGNQFHSEGITTAEKSEFHGTFYFLLNVAVGGDWPGSPDASTVFPQRMYVDYVRVYERTTNVEEQLPYGGQRAVIPGVIQSEEYDFGGQGVAYNDTEVANQGGEFRTDGVDIELNGEGGYNIGYINSGEWLEYSVEVEESAIYAVSAKVANGGTEDGFFHLEIDEDILVESEEITNTGGWSNWTSIFLGQTELSKGEHILRFVADQEFFNVDQFQFSKVTVMDIESRSLDSRGIVFPNPVHDLLFLNLPEDSKAIENDVVIYNELGKRVMLYTEIKDNLLDVSGIEEGMYLLEVQSPNTIIRSKFVKK